MQRFSLLLFSSAARRWNCWRKKKLMKSNCRQNVRFWSLRAASFADLSPKRNPSDNLCKVARIRRIFYWDIATSLKDETVFKLLRKFNYLLEIFADSQKFYDFLRFRGINFASFFDQKKGKASKEFLSAGWIQRAKKIIFLSKQLFITYKLI